MVWKPVPLGREGLSDAERRADLVNRVCAVLNGVYEPADVVGNKRLSRTKRVTHNRVEDVFLGLFGDCGNVTSDVLIALHG